MSWGYNGHYKINQSASLSFNSEMEQFMSWAVTLSQHASDADYRKDEDPSEGPKHYIDIDNYEEFIATGRIPQTYDSVIALHGYGFVIAQGILPWATLTTYDSLVASFTRFDWEKAVLLASDLGHYVADGHNPLHITRNYDGDYTGNDGVHSRYETGMINTFNSQIVMTGRTISYISNRRQYIFNYIYSNYIYVDSIMLADDYAYGVAGNTSSYTYKAALWEKTGAFTTMLFNDAAHSLAEMIFSAWVDAGKPDMNSGPGIFEFLSKNDDLHLKVSPNPVSNRAGIKFELKDNSDIKISILDLNGTIVDHLTKENLPAGPHEFSFDLSDLPEGIYFVLVDAGKDCGVVKIIHHH